MPRLKLSDGTNPLKTEERTCITNNALCVQHVIELHRRFWTLIVGQVPEHYEDIKVYKIGCVSNRRSIVSQKIFQTGSNTYFSDSAPYKVQRKNAAQTIIQSRVLTVTLYYVAHS